MIQSDNVLVSLQEACEMFALGEPAVRRWIAAGILKPVTRKPESRGRGGTLLFSRGDISNLVYGQCKTCGNGFKKETLKQTFCSKACRQKWSRRIKGEKG